MNATPHAHGAPLARLTGPARRDAMSAALARNWWIVALRGGFAILFGIAALVAPGATLLTLVLLFAAYMLVDGLFSIAAAVRRMQRDERWGLHLLSGLLSIVAGIAAFLLPAAAIWAAIYLLAAWALVSGGLMLASAFSLNRGHGRGWLGLGGVISLVFGAALLLSPGMSALVLTWWLGGYAIAFGTLVVLLAFALRGGNARALGLSLPGTSQPDTASPTRSDRA